MEAAAEIVEGESSSFSKVPVPRNHLGYDTDDMPHPSKTAEGPSAHGRPTPSVIHARGPRPNSRPGTFRGSGGSDHQGHLTGKAATALCSARSVKGHPIGGMERCHVPAHVGHHSIGVVDIKGGTAKGGRGGT